MPYIIDRGNVIPVNVDNNYDSKSPRYKKHDLESVFIHWDPKLCKNVATPNELPVVDSKNK